MNKSCVKLFTKSEILQNIFLCLYVISIHVCIYVFVCHIYVYMCCIYVHIRVCIYNVQKNGFKGERYVFEYFVCLIESLLTSFLMLIYLVYIPNLFLYGCYEYYVHCLYIFIDCYDIIRLILRIIYNIRMI